MSININDLPRMKIHEYGCFLAESVSFRSEDQFTKVGAVLINKHTKKIVATGYNGLKSGMTWPTEWNLYENRGEKSSKIIHAEKNIFNHLSYDKGPYILCMNLSPCGGCSDLIAANNVKEVYFSKVYELEKEFKYKDIFHFYDVKYELLPLYSIKLLYDYSSVLSDILREKYDKSLAEKMVKEEEESKNKVFAITGSFPIREEVMPDHSGFFIDPQAWTVGDSNTEKLTISDVKNPNRLITNLC